MGEKERAKRAQADRRRNYVKEGIAAGKTQRRIADELGISRERVSQLSREQYTPMRESST